MASRLSLLCKLCVLFIIAQVTLGQLEFQVGPNGPDSAPPIPDGEEAEKEGEGEGDEGESDIPFGEAHGHECGQGQSILSITVFKNVDKNAYLQRCIDFEEPGFTKGCEWRSSCEDGTAYLPDLGSRTYVSGIKFNPQVPDDPLELWCCRSLKWEMFGCAWEPVAPENDDFLFFNPYANRSDFRADRPRVIRDLRLLENLLEAEVCDARESLANDEMSPSMTPEIELLWFRDNYNLEFREGTDDFAASAVVRQHVGLQRKRARQAYAKKQRRVAQTAAKQAKKAAKKAANRAKNAKNRQRNKARRAAKNRRLRKKFLTRAASRKNRANNKAAGRT